ncbi:MAG TPA: hypothetical protein VHN11_19150 [Xanthobacteraceae bacterium]|jgi:hypothetical protein|nr:hypothetical protein [Xanthobacteraceae bacterium]
MSERATLDENKIAGGESLIRRLEERGCAVPAALWAYESDINEWRLYLALPLIYDAGPAAGNELVSQAIASLRSEEDFPIGRADITPVSIDHLAITQIAGALGTSQALSRLRIQGIRANGNLVQDVLIYRLYKPGLQPPTGKK